MTGISHSVRSEAIQAVADFSDVSADGVREAPVELVYDNSLFDIEFSISSDPSVIKVYWEAKGGQSE